LDGIAAGKEQSASHAKVIGCVDALSFGFMLLLCMMWCLGRIGTASSESTQSQQSPILEHIKSTDLARNNESIHEYI